MCNAGCVEEGPETLTHRFWTCAAHEHLRSPNFRAIRDTMELRHPCELVCGIVLNSFPLHLDTVDMQRCMVAIELNASRLLDERRATRDDPLAHQRETGTSYSHRKKRPSGVGSKTEWKTPETTHAVQHLVFSQDGARVRCSRCTRVASKSHSGQWRAFWMAECIEVRENQNLRQIEGSRSYWSGAGAEAMRDLVAVEDLLFSGNVQAPVNCRICRKAWPLWSLAAIITRKSCVLSHVLAHSWQPIGYGNVFSILLLSRHRILGKFHQLKTF